jgi:hypothetical protein
MPDPAAPPDDFYALDVLAEKAPPAASIGEDRRPCPMCGGMINSKAAKCRYCGEIFDPAREQVEAAERKRSRSPDDDDLSIGEWIVAVLCSGVGCIIGIVWMIQGKRKGKIMFGVSLLCNIIWASLREALDRMSR